MGNDVPTRINAFTVLNNGYVGIGVDSPLAKLTINGGIKLIPVTMSPCG